MQPEVSQKQIGFMGLALENILALDASLRSRIGVQLLKILAGILPLELESMQVLGNGVVEIKVMGDDGAVAKSLFIATQTSAMRRVPGDGAGEVGLWVM